MICFMKKLTFISLAAIVLSLSLVSCTSKEQKAFQAAVQSRQISQMRQFLADFPEAAELLDSAKNILSEWMSDSADYAAIKATADIVERYDLEVDYRFAHPDGLYLDNVNAMLDDDISEARAIKAHREALAKHLEEYRKEIEDIIYYQNLDGGRHFVFMTPPDQEGKGMGLLGTIVDGWGGFLNEAYKFRYEINTEDFEDDDIICHNIENNTNFTIEIYDKSLYITARGNLENFIGERDPEGYKAAVKALKESKK